ncbi:tetratricopeptide repeat protein [Flavobacterium sp. IMCC34852]|uniref:Tetratricopeptide repeat protein n=1 Tax=Flavobacterium rivulicola TaxID=2732161 RepID=A0A7Y3R8V6_9FLAO|nr:tetratricopeptide repeat protein [Flavobacterium sp. IMCC34852]NNT71695.1 tetratricopeptide repeat protein [Flavobacterium sp. IMCC34852]
MKTTLTALFLLVALSFQAQTSAELNTKGIEWAQKGDLKTAFDFFNRAIVLDPNFSSAYSNRGHVYRQQGQFELAVSDYTQSYALYPNIQVLYARANTYMDMEQYEKAQADYTAIINLEPTFSDIYFDRAYSYIMQKKYQEAMRDMEKQLELTPKDFKSLANLINLKKQLDLKEEALADYKRLLKDFPDAEDLHIVYNNRANLYSDLKQFDKALADINKALEIKPDYDLGYLNRAEIYQKMGNKAKACENFKKAQELKVETNRHFQADEDYLAVKKLCN